MALFKRIFGEYFDERSREISQNGCGDSDIYDERNEVTDPRNPIWEGCEVHISPYGADPTLPDPNELNQD